MYEKYEAIFQTIIVEIVYKKNISMSFSPQEVISVHCVFRTYFFNRFYVWLPLPMATSSLPAPIGFSAYQKQIFFTLGPDIFWLATQLIGST